MATTRRNITKRTNELIKNLNKYIKEDVKKLLDSGAINLDEYEDNYKLPKMMIAAILERQAEKVYRPPYPTRKDSKEIKNMKCFI